MDFALLSRRSLCPLGAYLAGCHSRVYVADEAQSFTQGELYMPPWSNRFLSYLARTAVCLRTP